MKEKKVTSLKIVFEDGSDYSVACEKGLDKDELAKYIERAFKPEPAEPLIKDEKIRKAVRAWAEASGVKKVEPRGVGDTLLYFIGEDKGKELIEIEFYANVDDYIHLAYKDTYTIAELCGEEEE